MRKRNNDESVIEDVLLGTLRDCAQTSRYGFVDKGNPSKLLKLSVMGFVTAKNGGYQVTEDGLNYLKFHKRELMRL